MSRYVTVAESQRRLVHEPQSLNFDVSHSLFREKRNITAGYHEVIKQPWRKESLFSKFRRASEIIRQITEDVSTGESASKCHVICEGYFSSIL